MQIRNLVTVLSLVAVTATAHAFTFHAGNFVDPAGLTYGTTIGGVDSQGYTYDPVGLGYNGATTGVGNGNARDYYWVQDSSGPFGPPNTGTIWDLGGPSNKVVVFPIIDHGPLPEEAWEYNVYLSDDPTFATYTAADLLDYYAGGWDANAAAAADDGVTVWTLLSNTTFRYVSVTAGNDGTHGGSRFASSDHEIDAVAGLTEQGGGLGVPEPGSLALLATGILPLLGLKRRNRK